MNKNDSITLKMLINQRCYVLAAYWENKADYEELELAETRLNAFIDSLIKSSE
jgi:hypothetical protein